MAEINEKRKLSIQKFKENHPGYAREYHRKWRAEHAEEYKNGCRERARTYRQRHPERVKMAQIEWRKLNPDYHKTRNEYLRNYCQGRRKSDPLFKLSKNLHSRIWKAFVGTGWKKGHSAELLGCSFEKAKEWIAQQFEINMNWENYGEWHVDHVIPLAAAKSEKELLELCHYTNLQPLWAIDNLKKGAR